MLVDRNNMHNVTKKFKILIKTKYNLSCGNNYSAVENKMNGFDEMTHIGMKGKLFG